MEDLRAGDPRSVGGYRLLGRLGRGGMGQVFLGRSPGGRPVAVKVVHAELAADQRFRRRFAREVEAARQVGGFFTAHVVDADPQGDPPWLVTAYIPGPSLREAVERYGPLPEASLGPLAAGLAEGLDAVHTQRLVHRDLKPGNVLLAADGPRLIDFGIAKAVEDTHLTHTGAVIGTPGFMAPEQVVGNEATAAADVFALGAVLVYAATGEGPFGQGATHAVNYRVVHEEPDLSMVPGPFVHLVGACLRKDPQARPGVSEIADLVPGGHLAGPAWLPGDITTLIDDRRTAMAPQGDRRTTPYTEPRTTRWEETDGTGPAAPGPRAPEPDPRVPEVFQLSTAASRAAESVKSLVWGLLSVPALGLALFVVGLLIGGGDEDGATSFALDVLFSTPLGYLWIMAAVFQALDRGKFDGYCRLVVGQQGISFVDERAVRLRDQSVSIPWDRLQRVRATSEAASLALKATFTEQHEPEKKWADRYSIRGADGEHTLCFIRVRNGEDAAVVPRLRSALAGFAGRRYGE
ncbi:serine/threonine-protein kinase [Streptomyces sp. UH6]|uniref:serine/threonine-protein kinase n=1 Tax=Streptomyces sp. UH6 TaxID=2748379 RepID=UPI0015D4BAD1|nr:serine/threonine-protein kinase [Streptomyces sp. UH6]NYV76214.1 serine/threonine protein kinase [Streptomyces sp. UH6]